jgi:hypothetical protein
LCSKEILVSVAHHYFPVHFMIGNNIYSSDQSMDGLWNATKLKTVDLSFAQLKGSIPERIGSFTGLSK